MEPMGTFSLEQSKTAASPGIVFPKAQNSPKAFCTVDDINPASPHHLNDPKLWELWYIPHYG